MPGVSCCTDCPGEWKLGIPALEDAVSMHSSSGDPDLPSAWCAPNIWALAMGFAKLTGDDIDIPFMDGTLPTDRYEDSQTITVPFLIVGDVTVEGGAPAVSEPVQLWNNIQDWKTNVLMELGGGRSTRESSITVVYNGVDTLDLTANIVIEQVREGIPKAGVARFLLDVHIPAGRFT